MTPQDTLYITRMLDDLKLAEEQYRNCLTYRGMSFRQSELDDKKANVDRLHELVRSWLSSPNKGDD